MLLLFNHTLTLHQLTQPPRKLLSQQRSFQQNQNSPIFHKNFNEIHACEAQTLQNSRVWRVLRTNGPSSESYFPVRTSRQLVACEHSRSLFFYHELRQKPFGQPMDKHLSQSRMVTALNIQFILDYAERKGGGIGRKASSIFFSRKRMHFC